MFKKFNDQHKLLKARIKSRIEIVLEFRPLTTRTSIESNLMYLFRADTIKSGFIFITLRLFCKVLYETWPRRPSMNHSHLSPSTRTSLTPGPSPWLIAVLWHAWPIGSPGSDHTRLDFDPRAGGRGGGSVMAAAGTDRIIAHAPCTFNGLARRLPRPELWLRIVQPATVTSRRFVYFYEVHWRSFTG